MASVEQTRALVQEKVESHLTFIWDDLEIDIVYQYALANKKITNSSRVGEIADDKEKLKELMLSACAIPAEDELTAAVVLADLVTAWQTTKGLTAAAVERKAAASTSTSSLPAPVPKHTYIQMGDSYKLKHGKKSDAELPGEPLMAKILQGIQDDNPKADPLTEVASVEDGEDEVTYAECGITGILKAHQRKIKKVPTPMNAEQVRFRDRVLDHAFLYGRF